MVAIQVANRLGRIGEEIERGNQLGAAIRKGACQIGMVGCDTMGIKNGETYVGVAAV